MNDAEAYKEFKQMKRILCPECTGEKVQMYVVEFDEREEQPCHTCGGEGIVFEITKTQYKKLSDAK